ncbi:FAD-binding protein [Candidatus Poribacteria bacterium]|nr:FAD-binding protein [Candidatus Poribacteria bacterium]
MTIEKNIYKVLEEIVGKDFISDAEEDLICHSYDATRQQGMPDLVIKPDSALEISEIMKLANRELIPVYPRGAASGLTGGAVPLHGGIALDMTRMNRILDIDEANLTSTVEPGVIVAEFQKEVEKHGLLYPPDPASNKFATLGGSVAECAGGLRGMKYGVTKDYVMALEAVLPTGDIIHTGSKTLKSVTGYDLTKLLVGSEGTLAIFTKIVVKLVPPPEKIETIMANFSSIRDATNTVSAIIAAKIMPRALEFVDEACIKAVSNYAEFEVAKGTKALLLMELDGSKETAARDAERVMQICRDNDAFQVQKARNEEDVDELWSVRRSISPSLYSISKGKVNEDICVPRSNLTKMLEKIHEIADKYKVITANFGHAGDGNIHMNILVDTGNPEEMERAETAAEEIFRATIDFGGTLSGEHGIGNTKSRYLDIEIGPVEMQIMKGIKAVFDPNGILNPGKIFYEPKPEFNTVYVKD